MEIKARGRPRVLTDEERKRNKTIYQLTKEWICPICIPSKNYTIAGKHCHPKTKKTSETERNIQSSYFNHSRGKRT